MPHRSKELCKLLSHCYVYYKNNNEVWFGQNTLRPAVFLVTRIGSGVFWLGGSQLRLPDAGVEEAEHTRLVAATGVLESQEAIPSDSNPLWRGEVGHLAPEAPYLWGWKHFWNLYACEGYDSAPVTHNKKRPHAVLACVRGALDEYLWQWLVKRVEGQQFPQISHHVSYWRIFLYNIFSRHFSAYQMIIFAWPKCCLQRCTELNSSASTHNFLKTIFLE